MPLTINTNVMSLNAQRSLNQNTNRLNKSLERLSSGYRINRSGDDAAGLQISETLRSQIRGSKKALDNTMDGLNLLNIVDGAYQTIQNNLQRIRELSVQGANDTYATSQRTAIAQEIDALRADIDRIANSTQFNGVDLLTSAATLPTNYFIQVGANTTVNDEISLLAAMGDTTTVTGLNGLSAASGLFVSNTAVQTYIGNVDAALDALNTRRSTLGSMINRLESVTSNLNINIENLSASESRIRNVDVASESAAMIQGQILQQASVSILSQANQVPQMALQLISGN